MNGPKRVLAYYYYLVFFSFSFCHIDPYESRIFTFIPLKGCVCKKGKNIVWLERDRSGVRFNGHWIPRNSASLVGPFCRQVHERHCFEVMENYFLFPFMLITCTMSTRTWMKRFSEIKGLRCKSPLIEKNSKKKIEFLWYYQIMCDWSISFVPSKIRYSLNNIGPNTLKFAQNNWIGVFSFSNFALGKVLHYLSTFL